MSEAKAKILRLLSQPEARVALAIALALAVALIDPTARAKEVPIA
ncbi:hypothetical protein [Stetteria hydrogenophila]